MDNGARLTSIDIDPSLKAEGYKNEPGPYFCLMAIDVTAESLILSKKISVDLVDLNPGEYMPTNKNPINIEGMRSVDKGLFARTNSYDQKLITRPSMGFRENGTQISLKNELTAHFREPDTTLIDLLSSNSDSERGVVIDGIFKGLVSRSRLQDFINLFIDSKKKVLIIHAHGGGKDEHIMSDNGRSHLLTSSLFSNLAEFISKYQGLSFKNIPEIYKWFNSTYSCVVLSTCDEYWVIQDSLMDYFINESGKLEKHNVPIVFVNGVSSEKNLRARKSRTILADTGYIRKYSKDKYKVEL